LCNAALLLFVVTPPSQGAFPSPVPLSVGDAAATLAALGFGLLVAFVFSLSESRRRQLVRARDDLQQVLDVLPGAVLKLDASGRVTKMNSAAESLLGVRMTGRLRTDFDLSVKHPDGTPARSEELPALQVLRTGTAVQGVQLVARHAVTGADVPILAASAPLRDRTGAVVGAVSVFQDLSELRTVEREREAALHSVQAVQAVTDTALAQLPTQELLDQLMARVAHALEVDNAALLLVAEDGRSLVVHSAYGVEHEQVGAAIVPIGQGIAGRIAATRQSIIVDDVRTADVANAHLRSAVRSLLGVPVIVQDRLLGVLHADSSVPRPFTPADLEVLRLVAERVGLVVDNARLFRTGQQRSVELAAERDQLQRILDMLPEAVVVYDADLRITRVNRVAKQFVGAEMAGKECVALDIPIWKPDGTPMPMDDLPSVQAVRTGETVRGVRLVLRDAATGEDVTTRTSAAPLRDANGAISGAVTILEDISALVAQEHAREKTIETEAHDLRNALTSIYGMSQILLMRIERAEPPVREQFTRSLQLIERATQRVTQLVGELLDSAQAEAGRPLTLALQRTDILALVRKVLEEQQQATDRHSLLLQTAERALHTEVDPLRLERALANLVGNAVKYSPRGGRVTVAVARGVGPNGAWLSIQVADQGLGIPAADLPHVFELHRRGSNVEAALPGTGLGLADVRRVAELHGGTVELASSEGEGTLVTMQLPLRHDVGTGTDVAS
jgi:signal transduction histidine kinase/putative methionine-R-sulfoxide reductase with GAF domain